MKKTISLIWLLIILIGMSLNAAPGQDTLKMSNQNNEKTQILILGTPHLRSLGESFKPSLLHSLLLVLEKYKPNMIGIESLPPSVIEDMERKNGNFTEVLDQFAKSHIEYGHISQNLLKISRKEAEEKVSQNLPTLLQSENINQARTNMVLYMLASYDLNSALLQWSYLPESVRETTKTIPDNISSFLNSLLKKSNEIYAIGLELAKRTGIQKFEPIDDHQDKDVFIDIVPQLMEGLKDNAEYKTIEKAPFFTDSQKRQKQAVQNGDLLSYYLYVNSPAYASEDIKTQWDLFLRTKLASGLDRSRLALWEVRNLNIASHIRRATVLHPGKRMLVIIGASHRAFLEAYLKQMKDVTIINLNDLTKK